jgi:hypothetical protein
MKGCFLLVAIFIFFCSQGQNRIEIVSVDSLRTHLSFLAGDELGGRGPYSEGLKASAELISRCYAKAKLRPFPGYESYFQPFAVDDPNEPVSDSDGFHFDNALFNVIGILDGKTKPNEAIIISAHYDHEPSGIDIYNGANDNASGVAALLALVNYYAATGTNERSIIFCAFSGEEMGLIGSTHFSKIIDEKQVVAMINMDMVGVSGFGKNKFMITGADYSNLKKIFKKNLEQLPYRIISESKTKLLFHRSDNLPFAKLGIPAHTLMTSDDDYNCYHQTCDDISKIDFENLGGVVKAIVAGISTIVSGVDTPSRIKEVKSYY